VRALDGKAAGDGFGTMASLSEWSERLDRVGRMHRLSLDVLSERGFGRFVKRHGAVGNGFIAGNGFGLGKFSKRLEARPPASTE
jgi:hypothetical protein